MEQLTTIGTSVQEVDQPSLERLLGTTPKVVVVEFYLTNCPICQQLAPVLEELSEELKEEAVFAKVDAQDNLDLALQYGVMVTPTIMLFCGRRYLGELVGDANATIIRNTVRDAIRRRSCHSPGGRIDYEPDGYG